MDAPSARPVPGARLTPRVRNADEMARLLGAHYDATTAAKLIERELRKARRSRSRTRFAFWAAVANALQLKTEVVGTTTSVDHQPNTANGQ